MPLSYCSYGQSCEMFNEVLVDSNTNVHKEEDDDMDADLPQAVDQDMDPPQAVDQDVQRPVRGVRRALPYLKDFQL